MQKKNFQISKLRPCSLSRFDIYLWDFIFNFGFFSARLQRTCPSEAEGGERGDAEDHRRAAKLHRKQRQVKEETEVKKQTFVIIENVPRVVLN